MKFWTRILSKNARMVDSDEGPESSGTGKKYLDLFKEAFLGDKQFFSITPKIEYYTAEKAY
jgi:hypothetical protein